MTTMVLLNDYMRCDMNEYKFMLMKYFIIFNVTSSVTMYE